MQPPASSPEQSTNVVSADFSTASFPPHAHPTPEPATAGLKLTTLGASRCPSVDAFLLAMPSHGASDFYLHPGDKESGFKIRGQIQKLDGVWEDLTIRQAVAGLLRPEQNKFFDENHWVDFSVSLGELRFRAHARETQDGIQAVFRLIPTVPPTIDELSMLQEQRDVIRGFAKLRNGLILIAGSTGSGKSTTIAALMGEILKGTRSVITLESPIEFNLSSCRNREGLVSQSEVGLHVASFAQGIKNAMRSAPDVIMVGEIRDIEEADAALQAAETGHLVVATIHARGARSAIDRVLGMYEGGKGEARIRTQIAASLQGVVYQTLVPTKDQQSRVAACEILIGTPGIANQIRKNDLHQIDSAIQSGGKFGMATLDDTLLALARQGKISPASAIEFAKDPDMLKRTGNFRLEAV